ncbi:MAG: hypothetical protein QXQ96_10155 [Sulfolobales archaeon]
MSYPALKGGEEVRNERIAKMIEETKRLKNPAKITLLWCTLMAHEMVHLVFGIDHDHPEFRYLEEEIIERTIEKALKDIDRRSRLETSFRSYQSHKYL